MSQAIKAYNHITVTPEFKEQVRLYEKARHDEAQALHSAEQHGEAAKAVAVAKSALLMGIPIDDIVKLTGLTHAEIEALGASSL